VLEKEVDDIESFAADLSNALTKGGFINVFGEPGSLKSFLVKLVTHESRSEIPVVEGEGPETTDEATPRQIWPTKTKITPRQSWSWARNNQNQFGASSPAALEATVVVTDKEMDFYLGRKVKAQIEVTSAMAREALLDRESVEGSIQRGVQSAIAGRRRDSGMSL
jgi:hypothetical protein